MGVGGGLEAVAGTKRLARGGRNATTRPSGNILSSNKRTKAQARKDRAALKRLKKSGLYSGKIDLRKPPSAYQQRAIKKLAAKRKPAPKTKSRAAPKPAAKKRKKIALGSRSKKAKVGKATITRQRITTKQIEKLVRPKNPLTTYALPFNRGGGETEWRRFTYDGLKTFLMEYVQGDTATKKRSEWKEYAIKETWSFDTRDERTEFKDDVESETFGTSIAEDEINAAAKPKAKKRRRRK